MTAPDFRSGLSVLVVKGWREFIATFTIALVIVGLAVWS